MTRRGVVKTVYGTSAATLYEEIRKLTPLGGRVLDVGSGYGHYHPHVAERCRELHLLDAFEKYLVTEKEKYPERVTKTFLGLAQEILPTIDDFYDIVLCVDFVEHLVKEDSLKLIEQLKRLGPLVVVFTCLGRHNQTKDWLNEGNDFHQTHKSEWTAEEFERLGFQDVQVFDHFHEWARARYGDDPEFSPHALWAVWREE